MKSWRQRPTVLTEDLLKRPGLDTLARMNPKCQRFRLPGQANLTVRNVYGQDRIRLLRCQTCGEKYAERRGTAFFNTKVAQERKVNRAYLVDSGVVALPRFSGLRSAQDITECHHRARTPVPSLQYILSGDRQKTPPWDGPPPPGMSLRVGQGPEKYTNV